MSSVNASHPIVGVLREQGRRASWLAEKYGVSPQYVHRMIHGHDPAAPAFRRLCAELLGVDESALFHADATPEAAA